MKYKITRIREREIEVNGARKKVITVWFSVLDFDYRGSVDLAKEEFTAKAAQMKIEKIVAEIALLRT
jgi:hypothetical protein